MLWTALQFHQFRPPTAQDRRTGKPSTIAPMERAQAASAVGDRARKVLCPRIRLEQVNWPSPQREQTRVEGPRKGFRRFISRLDRDRHMREAINTGRMSGWFATR